MQELEKILEEIEIRAIKDLEEENDRCSTTCKGCCSDVKERKCNCRDAIIIRAFKKLAKCMNDGWISAKERDHLPEAGEHVLVSIGTGFNPEKAFLSEDGHWTMLHAPEGYNDITDMVDAWRPLPEPYRPERCGGE